VGAVIALPLAANAQAPANKTAAPEASGTKALSQVPPPPTTAPVKPEDVKPAAPAVAAPPATSPPVAGKGSTAVPGWNNPPSSWGAISEKPQYASVPGREYNVLIQGAGREWRAFHNGILTQAGGWLLVLALAVIAIFYLIFGPIKL